jgi:hypothetical protein
MNENEKGDNMSDIQPVLTAIETLRTSTEAGFADVRKDIKEMEKSSIENGKQIVRTQTELEGLTKAMERNFEQHKEFYELEKKYEKFEATIVTKEQEIEKKGQEIEKKNTRLLALGGLIITAINLALRLI